MSVKILIPYNFTVNDEKSIDFVGQRYAKGDGVEVTLFHAYSPVPEINSQNDPIMKKMAKNTAYLRTRQMEHEKAMETARDRLVNFGIAGHNIHSVFRPVRIDVATDIIRLYKKGKFDALVLSRTPGNIINFFNRSVSKQVIRKISGGIGVHMVS